MGSNALSDFVFQSKYARYNPELKRKETFEEAVDRIASMHFSFLNDNYAYVFDDSEFCNDLVGAMNAYKEGKVYGSQRALQFGGSPILNKHAKMYNCAFTYVDRIETFKEIEWMLLCGCGVGVSVEHQHINKIPLMNSELSKDSHPYVIEDSIEGWAYAIEAIMSYYFYPGCNYPVFDYSKIRPKGAFITGGFRAPGPEGLKNCLIKIQELLNKVYKRDRRLTSVEIADIIAFEADSVLSGGVRRSAVSILFDPDDEDMYNAKIGQWWYNNPQRGRYNASAVLDRKNTSREVFDRLFKSTKEFGEPGFVWRSDPRQGFNPCFEIGMCPIDKDGRTGWQVCNLVSISGKDMVNMEDFFTACKHAATIATIQAAYNKFPFLGEVTEDIVKTDPLIGVSISGIMTNPDLLLDNDVLTKGANIVKEQNKKIAAALKINPASRTTCIKPDGNFGAMTGNTSGCHGEHSKRYIRRVQVNKDEEAGKIYAKFNPRAVKESIWSNNHTDNCIMFAIEAKPGSITKDALLGVDQLAVVRTLQDSWVRQGKRNPDDTIENNVSNTVQVPVDEWEEVADYIWDNRYDLAGISFIAATGDLDYNQAAYSEVLSPEEMLERYGEGIIFASGLIVDAIDTFGDLWKACDTFKGIGEKIFTTLEDAEDFILQFDTARPEDFYDKPYKEWMAATAIQYTKWIDLLVEIGYSEEFAEQLLDNDIPIPATEIQKYLDTQMHGSVENLSKKRDLIRRMQKYADKYYDGETALMINALKHVQLYHDWCDITKYYKPIDWASVKWKEVTTDVDTMAAASCSGGQCEITKL